jgi:hypothetical protein
VSPSKGCLTYETVSKARPKYKTRYNGISFKGLNEAKIYLLLEETLHNTPDCKLVYEPESFELKSLHKAFVPDYGLVFDNGRAVLYVESKCFDVDLEETQLKCSSLSLTGRPCLLLVGYPAYLKAQLWLNGLGGKFVELPFPEHAVQVASSFSPWTDKDQQPKINPAGNAAQGCTCQRCIYADKQEQEFLSTKSLLGTTQEYGAQEVLP